jgi:hypothetical protein
VGGVQEFGEVGFAEAFRVAFAAAVGEGVVDQAAAVSGAVADQAGDRDPDVAFGGEVDDRGVAAWGPAGRLGGVKGLAGFAA